MAKLVARNASIYVHDSSAACQSISGDTNSVTLSRSAETPEVTTFGNDTRQNLQDGLKNWELSVAGFANYGGNAIEEVLSGVYGASTFVAFGPAGSSSGCNMYTASAICSEYSVEFPVEGAATYSATFIPRSGSLTAGTFA